MCALKTIKSLITRERYPVVNLGTTLRETANVNGEIFVPSRSYIRFCVRVGRLAKLRLSRSQFGVVALNGLATRDCFRVNRIASERTHASPAASPFPAVVSTWSSSSSSLSRFSIYSILTNSCRRKGIGEGVQTFTKIKQVKLISTKGDASFHLLTQRSLKM